MPEPDGSDGSIPATLEVAARCVLIRHWVHPMLMPEGSIVALGQDADTYLCKVRLCKVRRLLVAENATAAASMSSVRLATTRNEPRLERLHGMDGADEWGMGVPQGFLSEETAHVQQQVSRPPVEGPRRLWFCV